MSQGSRHSFRRIAAACAALLMALLLALPVYAEQKYANWQEVASTMGTVLDGAVEAYGAGGEDAGKKATEQVNVAYYKFYEKLGFEKTVMASISGSRGTDVEHQFYLVKKVIRDGGSQEELKSSVETLKSMLTEDAITLDGGEAAAQGNGSAAAADSAGGSSSGGAAWQTFLAVLGLTLREGLEAILVIAAIIAYLVKTNSRKYLASVYIGAGLGVLFSVVLAMIFNGIAASLGDAQSGAGQEIFEGVTMFLAVIVLFYVSNWMLSKAEAENWNKYIKDKVQQSIDKGSMYTLSFSAFLAVAREGAELIMFFQGMRANITNNPHMLWAGLALAVVILVIVYFAITKLSVRLPLKPFFTFTSVLMFILCISFVGKGVYELQEADVIGRTVIPWMNGFNFELLGIYDRYENLIPQLILLALTIFTYRYQLGKNKTQKQGGKES
ncbi:FTR1 family iron permease [Stomatobaculum longum]|uniref:FTR1 family iron permease n=1 Tax=Stomatobaculum longum TaxID=796942 RepID=UPI0028E3FCA1|nr:FTR1 family protein [Stomatobaculum longum]